MNEKFLLYIDLLGFSELVEKDTERIKEIYEQVNLLNVHKHDAFQTIIFSDTILVYNKYNTGTNQDRRNVVMYMVEFVQDLLHRGVSIGINFRAIITYGEFEHYKLDNVECYYGNALVSAHRLEKNINGVGLFIDNTLEKFNIVFLSCYYDSKLNFVYLLQNILQLREYTYDKLPLNKYYIENADNFYLLKDEICLIHKYYKELSTNEDPKVRAKYMQTYQFYRRLMPTIFDTLEKADFSMISINPDVNWDDI